jgi:hypothetical protein
LTISCLAIGIDDRFILELNTDDCGHGRFLKNRRGVRE